MISIVPDVGIFYDAAFFVLVAEKKVGCRACAAGYLPFFEGREADVGPFAIGLYVCIADGRHGVIHFAFYPSPTDAVGKTPACGAVFHPFEFF